MDIERLFDNDRPVPGMRPASRSGPALRVEPVDAAHDGADLAANTDDVEDIEHRTTPEFPVALVEPLRPGPQLFSAHDPAGAHSENVRLLRTEVLLRHSAQHGAVAFAVVGASAAEGRSVLAAELALSLAQLGRSTLLIDADMRRPRQHILFGTDLRDGLAQSIVRGHPTSLFGVAGYPSLSLMTAGTCPANPIELLSDGHFESLMITLRNSYDFIVVDTPPCGDYADGLVVATVIGHVLTIHRAEHTSYKAARSMMRQLASARAQILGGVLNHF
jgi:receptor protein-tyrosine kinase